MACMSHSTPKVLNPLPVAVSQLLTASILVRKTVKKSFYSPHVIYKNNFYGSEIALSPWYVAVASGLLFARKLCNTDSKTDVTEQIAARIDQ